MNGRTIELQAADGHRPSAYCAIPDKPKGAIVLAQEVFGVSAHVRGLCDDYARAGFLTVAPALYDRVAPGIDLKPTEEDRLKGVEIRKKISWGNILDDMA